MYFFVKRCIDFILAFIGLVALSPLLLAVAIWIKLDSEGPVIFKQKRIGKNVKPYYMYKFRTMVMNAQQMGTGLYSFENDPRITRAGHILRKTSVDELPQLVNILKGDMALVGPRSPVVGGFPEYKELNEAYRRRFTVLPGITGLAQVVGRNDFSWDEKVEYDNIYIDKVKKYAIFYDIKILFMTVVRVFSMNDVAEKPENQKKNSDINSTGSV